jgi:hypothetical protein
MKGHKWTDTVLRRRGTLDMHVGRFFLVMNICADDTYINRQIPCRFSVSPHSKPDALIFEYREQECAVLDFINRQTAVAPSNQHVYHINSSCRYSNAC